MKRRRWGALINDGIETAAAGLVEDYWLPGGEPKDVATWVQDNLAWFDAANPGG